MYIVFRKPSAARASSVATRIDMSVDDNSRTLTDRIAVL